MANYYDEIGGMFDPGGGYFDVAPPEVVAPVVDEVGHVTEYGLAPTYTTVYTWGSPAPSDPGQDWQTVPDVPEVPWEIEDVTPGYAYQHMDYHPWNPHGPGYDPKKNAEPAGWGDPVEEEGPWPWSEGWGELGGDVWDWGWNVGETVVKGSSVVGMGAEAVEDVAEGDLFGEGGVAARLMMMMIPLVIILPMVSDMFGVRR